MAGTTLSVPNRPTSYIAIHTPLNSALGCCSSSLEACRLGAIGIVNKDSADSVRFPVFGDGC